MLQNVPQFYVSLLAIWLVGGIVVPLNTMYRERELRYYFRDSGCRAVICLESFYEVVSASVPDSAVEFVVTASELDGAPSPLPFALSSSKRIETPGAIPLIAILTDGRANGSPGFESDPSKPAVLSYTSGTTGPAKGAVNTHANLLWNACAWERYLGVEPSDTLFAIAPLFHITGLVAYVMTGLVTGIPVVLTYRFDPETALGEISRWRATVTVAAITAFVALLESPQISRGALQSLSKAFSGGAPVPEAVIKRFEEVTGHYIHNAYGLTETSSLCIGVPLGTRAPIDSKTGAVSVGRVVPGAEARVVDAATGSDVDNGEMGELLIKGPQVVRGYWEKPEETAKAIRDGWLFTGDLAIKDNDSWIYVLDRTKDIINTSGYKVWPREVEDVLYEHPAVREACVVGVADQYRGEAVHAVIATRVGAEVPTQDELIAFCRSRLAAFKCPRGVTFVDEVPKTTSGKLLRRELRRSLAESLTLGRL
jgi:long-chain acyl-CoA synthetase